MNLSIVQNGRVLRQIDFNGESYIEAPLSGEYAIRVHNDSHRRRMVVLSVDGINVINGENAGYEGQGYVFNPWQTADIPGFRRGADEVAAFTFKSDSESYAAQTGRGTSNVGVIGIAVFDEKVMQLSPPVGSLKRAKGRNTKSAPSEWETKITWTSTSNFGDNYSESMVVPVTFSVECAATSDANFVYYNSVGDTPRNPILRSVGTAYGEIKTFHTTDTDFTKASDKPNLVRTYRYGTTSQLKSWGVPIEAPVSKPNAFPASRPSVPAPPGWQG